MALGQTNAPPTPAPFVRGLALESPAPLETEAPGISLSSRTNLSKGLSLLPQLEQENSQVSEKFLLPPLDKPVEAPPPSNRLSDTPAFSSTCLFPHPDWQWRELPVRPEEASRPKAQTLEADALPFQSNRETNPDRMALVDRLKGAGLLQPPPPIYDSELERAVGEAFRPEIIHIGHAQFTCSIITAIARKNPFCLLDPSFLGISF